MSSYKLLIGGELHDGDATLDVVNPATAQILATCQRASAAQLDEAVAAAKQAFPGWAALPLDARRQCLQAIADTIDANQAELARLLTQEQGKPLADAMAEVGATAGFFRYCAGRELPVRIIADDAAALVEAHRQPLGVVGAIIPWNYPISLLGFKLPGALLAGNTVVVKPAPTTPLTTLRLGELIADRVPPGVLNIISDANDLGGRLSAHPEVRKISFTGSCQTGKRVMSAAADTLKRLTLELGGNDAGIVLEDVDPARVARGVFASAFENNGQVCIALKRLYVHDAVYEALCAELAGLAEGAVVGDGLEPGTELGPLQNRKQFEKVLEFAENARENGRIIAGGSSLDRSGFFMQPTIVRDISDGCRLVDEEQFGPILPVIRYRDVDDAVTRANASPYALGGSVWSADLDRARQIACRMSCGTTWVNKHAEIRPDIPFGGAGQSGIGTELGDEGLLEFTQLKVVSVAKS